jgi:hypothetical protein
VARRDIAAVARLSAQNPEELTCRRSELTGAEAATEIARWPKLLEGLPVGAKRIKRIHEQADHLNEKYTALATIKRAKKNVD